MKTLKVAAGLGILTLLLSVPMAKEAQLLAEPLDAVPRWTAQDVIRDWSQSPRALAEAMIEEYGEPNLVEKDALLWLHNGPWRRTTVYRTALYHAAAGPDRDYLQQTIGYEVPTEKIAAIMLFDKRLEIDSAAGELSSCSDSENSNYLALNLADEIVLGERSVADARSFYDRTLRLAAAGKYSTYSEGLLRPSF